MKTVERVEAKRRHKAGATAQSNLAAENRTLRERVSELEQRCEALERELEREREEKEQWRLRALKQKESLEKQVRSLELKLSQTEEKLEKVTAILQWFQKQKFGQTTEQTKVDNDPESDIEDVPNSALATKSEKGKRKGAPGHGRNAQEGLFEEINEAKLPESERRCRCCGKLYRLLPKRDHSTVLELMQELYKVVDIGSTYVKDCPCPEGNETPRMIRTPAPPRVFPRALFGPNLWTDILSDKFLFQRPLHRISLKYQMLGATVSVSTMSTGMNKIDAMVTSLYEAIKDHARGSKHWNMDETTWRVYGEPERKASYRWWLWVVVTPDACAYMLDPSRSSSLPNEFFQGVTAGTLVTDRYSAYKALLNGIKKAFCWVHVRRDFIKVRDGHSKFRPWAERWIELIDQLFKVNKERVKSLVRNLPLEEQCFINSAAVKIALEQIEALLETELKKKLSDVQRKPLQSLKRHWEGLTIFIDNPLVPMDNNAAERALRNPVVGRKNYYASGSERSGHFAAKMFSIFQTWLINGLDPIRLLQDFLNRCAEMRGQPPPVDDFLPWMMSEDRKTEFRLPTRL